MRNALLPVLAAAALLVGARVSNPAAACTSRHADSACVRGLTAEESAALARAIARLDSADKTECRALASFIRDHEGEARMLPYPIATPYGAATGDAHVVEDPTGTGRVHVADSVLTREGALARPMDAKVRTLVHDFAHLALDLPQFTFHLTSDAADDALARCLER
ncbi:MAG: hypothetical protein ACREOK_08110 [Gemmatimonadaceae bacterium]